MTHHYELIDGNNKTAFLSAAEAINKLQKAQRSNPQARVDVIWHGDPPRREVLTY